MGVTVEQTFKKILSITRWGVSGVFFFLAITKLISMIRFGIEPYEQFVLMTGLPELLKYYGAIACAVEFYLAVGVWIKAWIYPAAISGIILSMGGVTLSVYSLILKQTMDCHCGLLGDNEYVLLFQKLVLIVSLIVLAQKKDQLQY